MFIVSHAIAAAAERGLNNHRLWIQVCHIIFKQLWPFSAWCLNHTSFYAAFHNFLKHTVLHAGFSSSAWSMLLKFGHGPLPSRFLTWYTFLGLFDVHAYYYWALQWYKENPNPNFHIKQTTWRHRFQTIITQALFPSELTLSSFMQITHQ